MHSPQTEPAPYVGPVQRHQITPTKAQSFQSFSQRIPPRVKAAWGTIYAGGRLPSNKATRLFAELTTRARSSPTATTLADILTASDDSASLPAFSYGDAVEKRFEAARSACDREQSRVNAEITALERFRTTIEDLDVTTARKQAANSQEAVAYRGPPLSDVLEAFTETFCDVSHYDEDYGDHPLVSLAHELTPEIAKHIKNGGMVSPQVQSVIITKTQQAIKQRKAFHTEVDSERDRLADYQAQLEKADRQCAIACEDIYSFQRPRPIEYSQVMPRLSRIKTTLTTVAADRQADLLDSRLGHDHNGVERLTPDGDDSSTAPIDDLQLQPAAPLFKTLYRQQTQLEPVLSEAGRIAARVMRIESAVATLVSLRHRHHYPPHATTLTR